MASRNEELFSEMEQAQAELRECIENSRALAERSDALIRQVRSASPGSEGDAGASA